MKCFNCNHEIGDSERCPYCGVTVEKIEDNIDLSRFAPQASNDVYCSPEPQTPPKRKKKKPIFAVIIVVVIIAAAVFGTYAYSQIKNDINGTEKGAATKYTLVISKEDYEYEVGQKLYNNGIVINDTVWTSWMDKHYPDFTYINGEYNMTSDMSYEDIVQKLKNPDISHKSVKVCIPEGKNCMEIAKILEENSICKAADFLDVCKSTNGFDYDFLSTVPDNDLIAYKLEGFLFPATYDFAMNSDAHDIAAKMLETFDYHITDDMKNFCTSHNMTMYQLITLASVVQKEALGKDSAKNIASVFMNRLDKGAKLQSDVTYYYAAALRDKYGFSQDVYDSYYTYRCAGLPVGPITNSGDDILAATVDYPKTEYLYFFSDLKGDFHFAKTYDEFVALQQKYPWKE